MFYLRKTLDTEQSIFGASRCSNGLKAEAPLESTRYEDRPEIRIGRDSLPRHGETDFCDDGANSRQR